MALTEEIGIGDRLLWLPSNVGYFADGRIWPLNGALDLLRLGFLPIHDRLRVGLVTAYLQRVATGSGSKRSRPRRGCAARSATAPTSGPLARNSRQVRSLSRPGRDGLVLGQDLVAHDVPAHRRSKASDSATIKAASTSSIDALACAARAAGAELVTGDGQPSLRPRDGGWDVVLDSEVISVDAVVVTTPSPVLPRLVPDLPETTSRNSAGWPTRRRSSLCSTDRPLSDIYWLNIADPDLPFTGVIEHTNFIPPDEYGGKHYVYLSKYLEPDHPYFTMPESELIDTYVPYLKRINPEFDRSWIEQSWVFRERSAQPIITLNYGERIPGPSHRLPGLYLANTTQIYPEDRGTNYSVRLGNQDCRDRRRRPLSRIRPRIDGGQAMRPARTPRLELEEIVSTYEEGEQRLIALDGLSLTVGEAEFVALVGPSGSGKSTLLDIVAGLITQDSGAVRLDGG